MEKLCWLFSSRESTYDDFYNEYRNQIRYFITDLDGNVIDSIRLGNNLIPSNGLFYNNRVDSGFISSGIMVLDDESSVVPVIGKFDENADTLWWSTYSFNNEESDFDRYDVTGQVILPDESIVICGNLEHKLPGTNTKISRPFILKLDSDGCLEPGCRDTVNTVDEAMAEPAAVYPNPFTHTFTFLSQGEGQLYIYDLLGRPIFQSTTDKGENLIDIGDVPSGIYIYKYLENGRVEKTGKLIKS